MAFMVNDLEELNHSKRGLAVLDFPLYAIPTKMGVKTPITASE